MAAEDGVWQAGTMDSATRTTAHSTITGTRTDRGVERFLGIRFATAARFSRPILVPLTGTVDATSFGGACPQIAVHSPLVPGGSLGAPESEDCLHLNIWVPQGEGPFPVLVWIHGGSFLTGASSQAMYDGEALAARGLVVVSVNYRVGPLGFLDLRSLPGADPNWTANAGLHDQVAAMRWVRECIGSFAGDAANVTVMGESAGGGSILHLLGAAPRSALFDRAIVFSGSAGFTFQPEVAATIALRFLTQSATSIAELATVEVQTIVAAIGPTMGDPEVYAAAGMMPFHPSIDGELVGEAPMKTLERGGAQGCDLWLSTTRDEMALFVETAEMTALSLSKRVARYAGVGAETAEAIIGRYEQQLAVEGLAAGPVDVWAAIFSDREMTLAIRGLLDAASSQSASVYGSLFSWDSPRRDDGRPVGAAHATDLPFIFGTFSVDGWSDFVGATDATRHESALAVSGALQESIVKFCSTGNPGWPDWSRDRAMFTFGSALEVCNDPLHTRVELWEGVA